MILVMLTFMFQVIVLSTDNDDKSMTIVTV